MTVEYKAFMTATCDRCRCRESVSAPVKGTTAGGDRSPIIRRVCLPTGWDRIASKELCVYCAAVVRTALGGE